MFLLSQRRRIVYDSFYIGDGILVMNDDGSWAFLLIQNELKAANMVANIYPDWSLDGEKIVLAGRLVRWVWRSLKLR